MDVEILLGAVTEQLEVIFVDLVEPPDQGGPHLPEGLHRGVDVGVPLPPATPREVHVDLEVELLLEILIVPGECLHLHDGRVSRDGWTTFNAG